MKRKPITFFDVLKKHGATITISSLTYLLGVSASMMFVGADLGAKEAIAIILSFVIMVAFFVWVAKTSDPKHCTVCYDEFLPPSEYKSRELCQNCLFEKTKGL